MATQVTSSIEIAAPPTAIWELMCDPSRYAEIADPTDRMIHVPDPPFGLGSVYREYGGIPPFKGESEWRVTVFEPERRQVHVGDDGMMTLDLTIEIEPTEAGARLTQTLALKPRWYIAPVNALLWPLLMHRRAQAAMDRTVENVKRAVEQPE